MIGHVISVPVHFHLKKFKMEDIDRERIVVFIGISLLLSLIVNVYAHKLINNAFYTCAVEGWKRFQSFSSFPCGRAKRSENDRVDAILSLRFQWNENANFWKRIRVDGALKKERRVMAGDLVYRSLCRVNWILKWRKPWRRSSGYGVANSSVDEASYQTDFN